MKVLIGLLFFSVCAPCLSQHQDKVDFMRGEIFIDPDPGQKSIHGSVAYTFSILQDVDSVFLDAQNMNFSRVLLNRKSTKFVNSGHRVSIANNFKAGKKYRLELTYTCTPKQTVYFLGWDDAIPNNEQIWTQGQGKYTSHWLPSFDAMEEKVEFDMAIRFDTTYEVIANGKREAVKKASDDRKTWYFDMDHPMSSYLLAFAIGRYDYQELVSKRGTPIKNYYYPEDSLRVEPTYRHTKTIFDFLEDEIGVPYPWQNYKQIPVRDFLYAGMENTGATIFSDGYVIDSTAFVDKNYINVNAHELAHQWFGNLVTEKDGNHHWLHEGFATYYAYLAEKELFGDEHFYWKLFGALSQLREVAAQGDGQSLLDPKASSLTFYEKGAWALFMLRERIGDKAFKKGIQKYLHTFQFENVIVSDFLGEMEKASGSDLTDFRKDWLESTELPFHRAQQTLARHSPSLRLLFEMRTDLQNSKTDSIDFARYWNASPSVHLKKYILQNHQRALSDETIQKAFASDTVPIRQALAATNEIKQYPKEAYESLLNDPSYITIETALFKLWQTYPKDRRKYLNATRTIIGLPNKNVRLLWLLLAIVTEDYEPQNSEQYFEELTQYTSERYSWKTRMAAFQYAGEIGFTDEALTHLIRAANHHAWQFRKFAREQLDRVLKDPEYKKLIEKVGRKLKGKDLRYVNSVLN
ncbi:MAG TPA: M1 family metallopeptidase [Pricia sp.]|nr:M1 family metallopeptidase [Pricia sp.]